MPTVLRSGPYRFFFYSAEPGEPPHVHAARDDLLCKFWLEPVQLAKNVGFDHRELGVIQRTVEDNREALLETWHGYFGPVGR